MKMMPSTSTSVEWVRCRINCKYNYNWGQINDPSLTTCHQSLTLLSVKSRGIRLLMKSNKTHFSGRVSQAWAIKILNEIFYYFNEAILLIHQFNNYSWFQINSAELDCSDIQHLPLIVFCLQITFAIFLPNLSTWDDKKLKRAINS